MVAGRHGVVRTDDGGERWESLTTPDVLHSTFLSMRAQNERDLYVLAFGTVAHSGDGGDTWETIDTDRQMAVLHPMLDGRWVLGGDNEIGVMEPPFGPITIMSVPELDGDREPYFENNTVFTFAFTGQWYVAAERFGRIVRARSLDGPWNLNAEPLYGTPELLWVEEEGILLARGRAGLLVSCDHGASFEVVSELDRFTEGAAGAVQLVRTPDGILVTPAIESVQMSCDLGRSWTRIITGDDEERPGAFDVALAPDGSVWIVGYLTNLWRLSW